MIPLLQHAPTTHDKNNIRLLNRRQPMRNSDHSSRALPRRPLNRRLHQLLALAVERRRGFVQQQQFGVSQQGARETEALFLAAGETRAFGAEARGVPVWK